MLAFKIIRNVLKKLLKNIKSDFQGAKDKFDRKVEM